MQTFKTQEPCLRDHPSSRPSLAVKRWWKLWSCKKLSDEGNIIWEANVCLSVNGKQVFKFAWSYNA